MKDDAELRRGIKKVMEVIVGLLKDRVKVDDSPDSKRARTKKFIKEWFCVIEFSHVSQVKFWTFVFIFRM